MKQNKLKCMYNNGGNHDDNNNAILESKNTNDNDATNICEMDVKSETNHAYIIKIDDGSNNSNDNNMNVNMNCISKSKPKPKYKSQPIERMNGTSSNVIRLNIKSKNVNGIEFLYGYWCDGFVHLKYSTDAFNYDQGGLGAITFNSKLALSSNKYMHVHLSEVTTVLFAWQYKCANDFNPPNYKHLNEKRDDKYKFVGHFTCYIISAPPIPSNAKNINV